jgi:pseudaminic acid biosynthesis-associated methylase
MIKNEQQKFWHETYSEAYIKKNSDFDEEGGVEAWVKMLESCDNKTDILTTLECGSNVGRNIGFLEKVLPHSKKSLIELSDDAYKIVTERYDLDSAFNGSILDAEFDNSSFDLVYIMGVLIHIHPADVLANMQKMYDLSSKYILIGEYFNRTPVTIEYQGEKNKLFKSDFGKTFIENHNVELIDYGFLWGHIYDAAGFDDITWWLFKKRD